MSKQTHSAEERAIYFSDLRASWKKNKALANSADQKERLTGIWNEVQLTTGGKIGYYGFAHILIQMEAQGLEGNPYIDAKTFQGWIDTGYKVRKGQKSTLTGITWIGRQVSEGDEDGDKAGGYLFPKPYHLFHSSQVEPI